MEKLKLFNELICMACGSAFHPLKQLDAKQVAYVGVNEDPTYAPAAICEGSTDLSLIIGVANHQGTSSSKYFKFVYDKWAIGFYYFLEVL